MMSQDGGLRDTFIIPIIESALISYFLGGYKADDHHHQPDHLKAHHYP